MSCVYGGALLGLESVTVTVAIYASCLWVVIVFDKFVMKYVSDMVKLVVINTDRMVCNGDRYNRQVKYFHGGSKAVLITLKLFRLLIEIDLWLV